MAAPELAMSVPDIFQLVYQSRSLDKQKISGHMVDDLARDNTVND
jgi:hypothetical protein